VAQRFKFVEFFAGGGMARCGFGAEWECVFANDIDEKKAASYRRNWAPDHLVVGDVNALKAEQIPANADLVWASFPCQDLSLAGSISGLGTEDNQTRSGAFWGLWRIILDWQRLGCLPPTVVLENVYGLLTAHEGAEFAAVVRCLSLVGYRVGSVVLDGKHFLPQSRPRVFVVAVRHDIPLPTFVVTGEPNRAWHPPAMEKAVMRLSEFDYENWFWLTLPSPPALSVTLEDIVDDYELDVPWHTPFETNQLVSRMSAINLVKLEELRRSTRRRVATVYRRTRIDEHGRKVQRSELRTDGLAGCLRTPGGGSSRQFVIVCENGLVRSRLLSSREAARLMGLPDSYMLPKSYNEAYHLAGDGLIVPAIRYLAANVIEPILLGDSERAFRQAAE
jgi:DNA (cytosine-5)-methyltransferase 1